jgi:hypothetical protein
VLVCVDLVFFLFRRQISGTEKQLAQMNSAEADHTNNAYARANRLFETDRRLQRDYTMPAHVARWAWRNNSSLVYLFDQIRTHARTRNLPIMDRCTFAEFCACMARLSAVETTTTTNSQEEEDEEEEEDPILAFRARNENTQLVYDFLSNSPRPEPPPPPALQRQRSVMIPPPRRQIGNAPSPAASPASSAHRRRQHQSD